jgi:kinesin family protein 5
VYVEGLSWYQSPSPEFMLQCLNRGRENIVYAETRMNKACMRFQVAR